MNKYNMQKQLARDSAELSMSISRKIEQAGVVAVVEGKWLPKRSSL